MRRHTPFQTEGRAAATMDDRLRIEEDEVIVTLPGLRPGPGVRYGRADLGSSLFLVSCLTPTQDKTTLVEFSSVATNPTQKLRFLARVCSPREARPTLLDYPVYLKPFCKSQQSHHPRTSHVSHNYHNFGNGAKNTRPVRDRTPGIRHDSNWLVTNLLPANFSRWLQDSSSYRKG